MLPLREAPRRFRRRRRDHGQLLLVSGILIVLGFVATAFALTEVEDLQKQSALEQDTSFINEYQFLRSQLGVTLNAIAGPSTDNVSFSQAFNIAVASFRSSVESKGYDAIIQLGANGTGIPAQQPPIVECNFLTTNCAKSNAWQNTPAFTNKWPAPSSSGAIWMVGSTQALRGPNGAALSFDGTSDGIIWACGSNGAIVGTVVYFYLNDGATSVSETVLYATNVPWFQSEVVANNCN
jgi:hypothetical protein